MFDLQFVQTQICLKWIQKCKQKNKKQNNDSICYMGILCITSKERNKPVCAELPFGKITCDRFVMIFYGICNFCFISYAVGLLQYSKSVWSKVGTGLGSRYFGPLANISKEVFLIMLRSPVITWLVWYSWPLGFFCLKIRGVTSTRL